MGGKAWSVDEERCFWLQIMPKATSASKRDNTGRGKKNWEELAADMAKRMTKVYKEKRPQGFGPNKDPTPRKYNANMLCECYFKRAIMNSGDEVFLYIFWSSFRSTRVGTSF